MLLGPKIFTAATVSNWGRRCNWSLELQGRWLLTVLQMNATGACSDMVAAGALEQLRWSRISRLLRRHVIVNEWWQWTALSPCRNVKLTHPEQ